MRLLHTSHFCFREFFDEDVPEYAILSHRWGPLDEEVSHEDFLADRKVSSSGYRKIQSFCDWAASRDFDWVWIDTCCIDKRSSAELSEAINSMFLWYQRSSECVVYLADIHERDKQNFCSSKWFTRGWTLQELLAPADLLFVTQGWRTIGRKSDKFIAEEVSSSTGIPTQVLHDPGIIHDISIARRMSWAARRRTTKIEDLAYCLLGIFDVNMPLLYGEGWKAFQRLQLHIMEQSDDESIYAWRETVSSVADSAFRGLLAKEPSQFVDCHSLVTVQRSEDVSESPRITTRCVEFWTALLTLSNVQREHVYLHRLQCAQARNRSAHLDAYVTGKAIERGELMPCFIALSRKRSGDLYSRVKVTCPPWQLGNAAEYMSIARQPKRAIGVRTSFSVNAVIDFAYHGDNDESAGEASHRVSARASAGEKASRESRQSLQDRASRDIHEAQRRESGPARAGPDRNSADNYLKPDRGDRRRASQREETAQRSYEKGRRRNSQRSHRSPSSPHRTSLPYIPETYIDPARYPTYAYDQPYSKPRAFSGDLSAYMTFNDPSWIKDPMLLRRSSSDRQYDIRTACGFPCSSMACNSDKGKEFARKLRLSGYEWHAYAGKLMRGGWDLG